MDELNDVSALIIAGFVMLFVGYLCILGLSYGIGLFYNGAEYDVTVVIQAVEKSSRFGEHTNVWAQVYGDQDITYFFKGYHDFEVGKKYRIHFRDEIWFRMYIFQVVGVVKSAEMV